MQFFTTPNYPGAPGNVSGGNYLANSFAMSPENMRRFQEAFGSVPVDNSRQKDASKEDNSFGDNRERYYRTAGVEPGNNFLNMMYAWGTGNYPGFDRKSVS
jgi:hypothetical protein